MMVIDILGSWRARVYGIGGQIPSVSFLKAGVDGVFRNWKIDGMFNAEIVLMRKAKAKRAWVFIVPLSF